MRKALVTIAAVAALMAVPSGAHADVATAPCVDPGPGLGADIGCELYFGTNDCHVSYTVPPLTVSTTFPFIVSHPTGGPQDGVFCPIG